MLSNNCYVLSNWKRVNHHQKQREPLSFASSKNPTISKGIEGFWSHCVKCSRSNTSSPIHWEQNLSSYSWSWWVLGKYWLSLVPFQMCKVWEQFKVWCSSSCIHWCNQSWIVCQFKPQCNDGNVIFQTPGMKEGMLEKANNLQTDTIIGFVKDKKILALIITCTSTFCKTL